MNADAVSLSDKCQYLENHFSQGRVTDTLKFPDGHVKSVSTGNCLIATGFLNILIPFVITDVAKKDPEI